MNIIKLIREKKNDITKIATKYGAEKIQVFGSVARGEDNMNSDIDFLVKFQEGRSLFDLIGLKNALEELLHKDVDVVTEDALHWSIKEQVKREVIEI